MRLQFGDTHTPTVEGTSPEVEGWHTIRSPSSRMSYLLAALAGVVLLSGLCAGMGMWSLAVRHKAGMATANDVADPWGAVAIALVVFIPLHEFLHLLGQPQWGTSSRSVVVIWPARLRFGVYYEGCMSRRRWLVMRLAPLMVLSVLPACVVALLQAQPLYPEVDIGLQVLMVLNALGSGGDIVAALLVVSQVPPAAQMCFQAGRAYWRPA